eukprot:TRINITY_DN3238_c0_g1_i2.p1 TRINITY_DN3238_c0_g1~~TRINITY_DN3238_c0_g1_i2.p1  ORF type:complete len:551 (+),score=95.88 TRINITY_DN3238_c0_g1_i2:78-1655(+)
MSRFPWIVVGILAFLLLVTITSRRRCEVERRVDPSEESDPPITPPTKRVPTKPKPVSGSGKPAPRKPVLDNSPRAKEARDRQAAVKEAFLHAWKGYRQYAWGYDELRPLTNSAHNWLGGGLGATIVDSLDTLLIMGLDDEFADAREWIATKLNFDLNTEVSVFETCIRVLGGLEAAYDLTNDAMFLEKAREIGDRLSFAFNTSSGIPWASINLVTHSGSSPGWTGGSSILAEMGTMQLEYMHLAHHTGRDWYREKADKVINILDKLTKPTKGLYPMYLNPHSGQFSTGSTSFGALGDSFYEYLLKQWLFTGKQEPKFKRMYDEVMEGVLANLIKKSNPSGLTYIAEWSGSGTIDKMDHLACFVGGMFALGAQYAPTEKLKKEHLRLGEEIGETCYQMYHRSPCGISPESVYFRGGEDFSAGAAYYILRPETVETFFYLWRITKDQKWRDYGWEVMENINKHCRTGSGYSGLRDVQSANPQKDDQMQSFFLAETLKYLYLLFSEDWLIPLDEWVFNTEAHPLHVIR